MGKCAYYNDQRRRRQGLADRETEAWADNGAQTRAGSYDGKKSLMDETGRRLEISWNMLDSLGMLGCFDEPQFNFSPNSLLICF
jgi:hypothetical protein